MMEELFRFFSPNPIPSSESTEKKGSLETQNKARRVSTTLSSKISDVGDKTKEVSQNIRKTNEGSEGNVFLTAKESNRSDHAKRLSQGAILTQMKFEMPEIDKLHGFIAENRSKWGKTSESTMLDNPEGLPCKILYKSQTKEVFIIPVNVEKGNPNYLGNGEFKSVRRALNYDAQEFVAFAEIQIKPEEIESGETPVARKEVECLSKLKEKQGICNLVDASESRVNGEDKIAMMTDYYNGGVFGDSAGVLDQKHKGLGSKEKMNIAEDLLSGLDSIHKKKIAHNDINTSNILIKKDSNGEYHAALFDFGQADIFQGKQAETQFKSQAKVDINEMGGVLYKLFIDEDSQRVFKGREWTKDAYAAEVLKINKDDSDYALKLLVMKMVSPPSMNIRPTAEDALKEFTNIKNKK
jgi:Protein kinase domain